MGILEEFQAYVQANTPRNTRPAVSPAMVIDHGLLGGRISQMPQRAQSMHEGLLGAPAELKQLTSPEFKRKLDEQLKQPAAIDRDKMVSMGMDLLQTTVPLGGLVGMTKAVRTPTQYEIAHDIAQKNAVDMLGLPPNNTAMDRARAMGFETAPSKATYHGARGEIVGDIDPARSDFGFHTGTLDQAEARLRAFGSGGVNFDEGANVMPLMKSKYANLLKVKDEGSFHADALAPQLEKKKILAKGKGKQIAKEIDADWKLRAQYDPLMRDAVTQHGYDGIKYANSQEGEGMSYAFSNPSVLRSRFAAFDPAKEKSWDLMAGLAPYIGIGGLLGLGAYGRQDDQPMY